MATDVDWDVPRVTRDLIDDLWAQHADSDESSTSQPTTELKTKQKGVSYTQEYILVSAESELSRPYVDGPMDVVNTGASALVEASTPESRSRMFELWRELILIAELARHRGTSDGTPGNWDTLRFNGTTFPDEMFKWWNIESVWMYDAKARTV